MIRWSVLYFDIHVNISLKIYKFQEQFKSFWHKSERLPITQILGLVDFINKAATKEELANATTNNKGIYSTDTLLKSAYPTATNRKGFYAFVGIQNPFRKWEVAKDGGQWIDTGEDIDIADVDLAEYAKKTEVKDVSDGVDEIKDELGMDSDTPREIIPYAEGGAESNNTNQWFYLNQSSLVGKTITGIKANFKKTGTFTILFGKNMNSASYSEITRETFTITKTGGQTLELSVPFEFAAENCIGFNDFTNTATFMCQTSPSTANPIGGDYIGRSSNGSWGSGSQTVNLCIGVIASSVGLGSNYVKKNDLESEYSDSREKAPASYLLDQLHRDLYGKGGGSSGGYSEIIPYGEGDT